MKKDMITLSEFQKLLEEREVIFFDTETTGFSGYKDRLLSFSAIKIKQQDGKLMEVARMNQLFDPDIFIPENITEINHIDNKTVEGCPKENECVEIINAFIGEDAILAGYNVGFDMRFMDGVYSRMEADFSFDKIFDVYAVAKQLKIKDLTDKKLSTITSYFGADIGLEFHNSIDDVIATYRVFEKIIEFIKKHPEQVINKGKNITADTFCLGIFGPENFQAKKFVYAWLDAVMRGRVPEKVCFVVDKSRGVADIATEYAREHGIHIKKYITDWNRYGKSAAIIKDKYMHKFLSEKEKSGLLVFDDGSDQGVQRQTEWAKDEKLPVKIVDLKKYKKQ